MSVITLIFKILLAFIEGTTYNTKRLGCTTKIHHHCSTHLPQARTTVRLVRTKRLQVCLSSSVWHIVVWSLLKLIPISCLSMPSSQCWRAPDRLMVSVGRQRSTIITAWDRSSSERLTTTWWQNLKWLYGHKAKY